MKKLMTVVSLVLVFLALSAVSVSAEGPSFMAEIDIPGVSPQYRVVDCNFYLSASEEVWVEVEYDSTQIGDTSTIRSKFHLLPELRVVSSFILFPEQSGYFTATVRIEGEDEIVATFSKWIMVDPDPESVLWVQVEDACSQPRVTIDSRVETYPEGIWTVIQRLDNPSGPVVVSYTGPNSGYQKTMISGQIFSLRGGNSLQIVPGGEYRVILLREAYSMAPPYMSNLVFSRDFSIRCLDRVYLPLIR